MPLISTRKSRSSTLNCKTVINVQEPSSTENNMAMDVSSNKGVYIYENNIK